MIYIMPTLSGADPPHTEKSWPLLMSCCTYNGKPLHTCRAEIDLTLVSVNRAI